MLLKRLAGGILVRNGIAVQSFGFKRFLPVGKPEIIAEYLNRWGVDEICLLDISPDRATRGPDIEMVRRVAASAFVPLCYGGGLSTIDQVHDVIAAGADKVLVQTGLDDKALVAETVDQFGAQALVACIDHARDAAGNAVWFSGGMAQNTAVLARATYLESLGVGEILLHATDRDGRATGLDMALVRDVGAALHIPVIAMGGAARADHVADCLGNSTASAVVVGNRFNHTEHSVMLMKKQLQRAGVQLRMGITCKYDKVPVGPDDRLQKRKEDYLDDLGFIHVEREVI